MQKTNLNTTLAIFFVATAVVLIGGLLVTVTQQAAFAQPTNPKKVTICHNEEKEQTIGAPGVAAHVRNQGDTVGPCPPT
jgi:hypothetical protein